MTSLPSGVEDDPTRPEWCGQCSDDTYRVVEDVDGDLWPCPICSPLRGA